MPRKEKTPLVLKSFSAKNSIGKVVTYWRIGREQHFKPFTVPFNPKTPAQEVNRLKWSQSYAVVSPILGNPKTLQAYADISKTHTETLLAVPSAMQIARLQLQKTGRIFIVSEILKLQNNDLFFKAETLPSQSMVNSPNAFIQAGSSPTKADLFSYETPLMLTANGYGWTLPMNLFSSCLFPLWLSARKTKANSGTLDQIHLSGVYKIKTKGDYYG